MAVAFFVRLVDPDEASYREDQTSKALLGIKNNAPEVIPHFNLPGAAKRRFYREFDIQRPVGVFSSDLPVVGVPEEAHEPLLRYARKLACALFYREMGRPAPPDYCVWTSWYQGANRAHMLGLRKFVEMTPLVTKGERPNLEFGNRFGYRCNKTNTPDLFAALAQFGEGLTMAMVIVNPDSRDRLEHDDWVSVGDIYPTVAGE